MIRSLISVILILLLIFTGFIPSNTSFAQDKNEYTIAVLDFEATGISQSEAKSLSNNLSVQITRIVNSEDFTKTSEVMYTVVERSQMDKIFEQFEIQNTGCTDISCAVEFGKMLSVERIIIGSIGLVGETYTININMVDVETSKILNVADYRLRGEIDKLLNEGIPNVVNELLEMKKSRRRLYIIAGTVVVAVTAAAILFWPSSDKDNSAEILIDLPIPSD
ncbi:CsgG/HfaB family protein [Candidatus Latescibacterota bacterium]